MKTGWPTVSVGESCAISSGGTPSRSNAAFWNGSVPWVSAKDLKSDEIQDAELHISEKALRESATKIAPEGSLLILVRGMGLANGVPIGEVVAPVAFNQDIRAIKPPKEVVPRFLLLALRHTLGNGGRESIISSAAHGTLKIDADMLAGIRFPVPSLAEQQRIIGILDKAFEAIATAKASAEKNLQNARAVFESYRESMFSHGKRNWTEKTLDHLAENLDSKRVPITKADRKSGEYPYYGASGVVDYVDDYIFDDDVLLVSEDGANLLARSTPIAFSVTGKCWVNNHAHVLKFDELGTQHFVEAYLESIVLDEYIRGAAQPKLTQGALNSIPIPMPKDIEERRRVVDELKSVSQETGKLDAIYEQKITALNNLKKSLLHQAFSGQL